MLSRHSSSRMFSFNAYALFLDYDADAYEKQKETILEQYVFLTETTENFRDVDADWNGFFVRPVQLNEDGDPRERVKNNLFIGFDDEAHRILYASYNDHEVDEINDLEEELDYYFYYPKELRN